MAFATVPIEATAFECLVRCRFVADGMRSCLYHLIVPTSRNR